MFKLVRDGDGSASAKGIQALLSLHSKKRAGKFT